MTSSVATLGIESSSAPSWSRIIANAIEARLYDLHTGLPAKVESYDPASQSVSVKPVLLRVFVDDEGLIQEEEIPVITNVPVHFPAGGGFHISWPIVKGDIVFLAFAERSIDRWLQGTQGQIVDPEHSRKHDLSDAVAIATIRQRTNPIPGLPTDRMKIGLEDGTVLLELTKDGKAILTAGAEVLLGSSSAIKGVARDGDGVTVTIPPLTVITKVANGVGTLNPDPIDLDGSIIESSSKVKAED